MRLRNETKSRSRHVRLTGCGIEVLSVCVAGMAGGNCVQSKPRANTRMDPARPVNPDAARLIRNV